MTIIQTIGNVLLEGLTALKARFMEFIKALEVAHGNLSRQQAEALALSQDPRTGTLPQSMLKLIRHHEAIVGVSSITELRARFTAWDFTSEEQVIAGYVLARLYFINGLDS